MHDGPSPTATFGASTQSISPTVTPSPTSEPSQSPTPSQSYDPNDPNNQVGGGDRNSTDSVDGTSTCFPAGATVLLESGETITLSQLSVGDRVLSGRGGFSEVLAFTHANSIAWTQFIRVKTAGGHALSLTTSHFLPVNGLLLRAGDVRVGDVISTMVMENRSWTVRDDHVTSVEFRMETGLYNPQTARGDIVVDGVIASCYTDAVEPLAAHALLSPLRGLAQLRAGHVCSAIALSIDRVSSWVTG